MHAKNQELNLRIGNLETDEKKNQRIKLSLLKQFQKGHHTSLVNSFGTNAKYIRKL